MSLEQTVIEKLRVLPIEQQREVLDFVEFLNARRASMLPRRSIKGLWADLNIDITAEDIDEARREMWRNFPRDIEP